MKNVFLLVATVLLFTACEKENAEKTLQNKMAGRWSLIGANTIYIDEKSTLLQEEPQTLDETLVLKKNNFYTLGFPGLKISGGYELKSDTDNRIFLEATDTVIAKLKPSAGNRGLIITGDLVHYMEWENILHTVKYKDDKTGQIKTAPTMRSRFYFRR
jgi:hypothetical protein